MTERKKLLSSVASFITQHWGEIYTSIDILTNILKGVAGGGEIPDTIDPKIKGIIGFLGLKDERDILLKLRALKNRKGFHTSTGRGSAKFKRFMGYFAWETDQAKELQTKLGYRGSNLVLMLYLNRLRTLFAGIPDVPGSEKGTRKTVTRMPAEGANETSTNGKQKISKPFIASETTVDEPIKGDGSQPGVDVLELLADEISENWLAAKKLLADNATEQERLEKAYELTRDNFQFTGFPRMPRVEDVPDITSLLDWVKRHGKGALPFLFGHIQEEIDDLVELFGDSEDDDDIIVPFDWLLSKIWQMVTWPFRLYRRRKTREASNEPSPLHKKWAALKTVVAKQKAEKADLRKAKLTRKVNLVKMKKKLDTERFKSKIERVRSRDGFWSRLFKKQSSAADVAD